MINTMKIVRIPCFFPSSFKASKDKVERFLPPGNVRQRYPVIEKRFPHNQQIQVHIRPYKDQKYEYIVCVHAKKRIPIDFSVIHESNCLIEFVRNGSEIQSNLYVQVKDTEPKVQSSWKEQADSRLAERRWMKD